MNVIDLIDSNLFLKKLFPDGLRGPVYLGQFGLDVAGRFSMNIHTKQKPAIEVSKWGLYGQSYDVIVIELLGCGARNISIENWINADFALFDFSKEGDNIRINAREADWSFGATVENFHFQRCSTYIDGRMDE
jgi:hypothetical protein